MYTEAASQCNSDGKTLNWNLLEKPKTNGSVFVLMLLVSYISAWGNMEWYEATMKQLSRDIKIAFRAYMHKRWIYV